MKSKPYWLQRQFWRCNSRHGCLVTAWLDSHGFGHPESDEGRSKMRLTAIFIIYKLPQKRLCWNKAFLKPCFDVFFYLFMFFKEHWERDYLLQFPLFIIAECKMHDLTAFSNFNINILQRKKVKNNISIFFIESNNSKSNQWAQINCAAKSHYNYTGWRRPFVKYKLRPKWHTMHALSTQSCSVWIIYKGILSFITESDAPLVSSTLKSPIAEAKQCYSCWKQTLGSWCCETYSQPESELLLVVSKPLSPGPS